MKRLLILSVLLFPFHLMAQCNYSVLLQNSGTTTTNASIQLACQGESAFIQLQNFQGISPFTCVLDSAGQTIEMQSGITALFYAFSPVQAGVYSVIVIDSAGASCSSPVSITEPDLLEVDLQNSLVPSYCVQDNGEMTLSAIGGTPPYTYFLDGTPSAVPTFTALLAGLYSYHVQDANNCQSTIETHTLIQTIPMAVEVVVDTTVVTAYPTGGEQPYSYSWFNGCATQSLDQQICAGTFLVTVTDARACEETIIFSKDSMKAVIDTSLVGIAEMSGGYPPYQYLWSTGDSTASIDSLCAGDYLITVTDDHGCVQDISLEIPVLEASFDEVSATLSDVSGGFSPYSYEWYTDGAFNGQTAMSAIGLCPAEHRVVIVDNHGCQLAFSWSIDPIDAGISWDDVDCEQGDFEGQVDLNVTGGTEPYTYLWSNGEYAPSLMNINPGTQEVIITDYNGCVHKDQITFSALKEECVYNVFSPRVVDGVNDVWAIDPAFLFDDSSVKVYDRWGKKVFHSNGYTTPWDGKNQDGRQLDQGVYFYVIDLGDGSKPFKGSVTIY